MPALSDLQVGLFFWAEPDARETLHSVMSCGVTSGQLALDGTVKITPETTAEWKAALAETGFHVVTVFAAYEGEDYADIPTVVRSVGFVPKKTRAEREIRTKAVIDFAAALGVKSFGCHVGYIPEDKIDPDYEDVRDMVRRICDYAGAHGMTYCLETGQEPAEHLLEFFHDTGRQNLKINFDPANMILYGTGDPHEAFHKLAKHVVSVHAKDGDWPDPTKPGSLGTERPLGQGSVDLPRFVQTVRQAGYTGTLNIESGVHGEEQKWAYLKRAVDFLRGILR